MIVRGCVLPPCGGHGRKQFADTERALEYLYKDGPEPHETQSQHLARRGHHPTAPEERGFCRRVPDEMGPAFCSLHCVISSKLGESRQNTIESGYWFSFMGSLG